MRSLPQGSERDKLYRLTDADYSSGEAFAYGYDPVGNRTVQTRTLTATTVITYAYDAANRLDYFYEDGVLTDLDWDANGNLLTQGTSVYTWDAANRLVSAEVEGVVSAYEYDGLGNRTAQTVGGVTTEYALDVGGGLPEVIVATTGGASTRYVQVQGQILAEHEAGAWRYVLPDHLGSVRTETDTLGQVTVARHFDPFGVPLGADGGSPFGYTGEWWQGEVSLLYLRARWYDADTGRFITPDPWPGDPLDPSDLFPSYQYASDNPINYTDPTGMWRWWLAHPLYHMPIEDYYEGMLGFNPDKQLEYPIPLTPFRHPDMFNSMLGDIYEIEPWYLQARGAQQVTGYIVDLLNAAQANQLKGSNLGIPYDWNLTPFRVGTGIDWPGKFRRWMGPAFPAVDLVADYAGHGVVIYWIEPNVLSLFGTVPFLVPNKRLVRPPNWVPSTQPVPQPAYAMSVTEACGYTLIVVGGIVIIVTLVEDITLVGTIDDIVTVPGGLLLINLGQRLAVFVPAQ